jgi:hypothetical protein
MGGGTLDLVHNERIKLLAAALDRLSTAFASIGALVPTAGLIYGSRELHDALSGWSGLIVAAWITCAIALHWSAYRVLGDLK